ncbi:hypothetical protein [Companilactobacillus sp.]|uniref:hypothetical protein n=1 Tax=Companilactobacillus sp. TaxID=2767905 RepID=UPI0026147A9C|nr:hypothetical protein [Companilactobacillus sp.]
MELNIGDVVEFKHYEDIDEHDRWSLDEWDFPKTTTVSGTHTNSFRIKETFFDYSYGAVKTVHPKKNDANISDLHEGDEVLIKATVKKNVLGNYVVAEELNKEKLIKINVHHKFIVQDDYYGMYISGRYSLSSAKSEAKIYSSRNEANEAAADMHLNAWDVIPYDN